MSEQHNSLALSAGLTAKTKQLCLGLEHGAADLLELVTPTTAELLLWWFGGLDFWSGLLFGLLLSMPVSYVALRPSRERLSEALVARNLARRAQKEQLRARLSGEQPPA